MSIGREQPAQHIAIFVPDAAMRAGCVWPPRSGAPARTPAPSSSGSGSSRSRARSAVGSIRTGLAALCADVAMDPDYRSFPGGRTRSSLTVPVGPPDAVVAVINLEAPWVAAFSIRDYERMTERAAAALATFPGRSVA